MPVLYAGHYREQSGWGQVTRDMILALDAVGVPVVPRSLNLGLATNDIPERIIQLEEEGNPQECETVIQHVLPHYMKYDSHFRKNIGIFEFETQGIKHTQWVDHLNIMNELWVPCSDMANLRGVRTPAYVVPHTCNIQEFYPSYEPLAINGLSGKFVFYFIGQYNRRKHLAALLRAFHTEFDRYEPVALILKVNRPGSDPQNLAQDVIGLCNSVKDNLGMYKDIEMYHQETIISVNISREELLRLHATGDCFVMPSFGEAWCSPAFDAMAMSNIVIASNTGGPKDYIDHGVNGFLVDGSLEPVFGEKDALNGFGTARELEFDISISDLQRNMRHAFEQHHNLEELRKNAIKKVEQYDYQVIGNQMKELLGV